MFSHRSRKTLKSSFSTSLTVVTPDDSFLEFEIEDDFVIDPFRRPGSHSCPVACDTHSGYQARSSLSEQSPPPAFPSRQTLARIAFAFAKILSSLRSLRLRDRKLGPSAPAPHIARQMHSWSRHQVSDCALLMSDERSSDSDSTFIRQRLGSDFIAPSTPSPRRNHLDPFKPSSYVNVRPADDRSLLDGFPMSTRPASLMTSPLLTNVTAQTCQDHLLVPSASEHWVPPEYCSHFRSGALLAIHDATLRSRIAQHGEEELSEK